MGRPGKWLTVSMFHRANVSNKKQKARFSITNITKQDFRKFLRKFNNSLYLCYKSKQVQNEPTEAYSFLIKHITNIIKTERHVLISTNFVKSGVNKTIGHINKVIKSEELEINNVTTMCVDKYKQTLSAYGIKGEEKTLSMSEKKENSYVENLKGNKRFKNSKRESNFEVENFGRKHSVNWNPTDLIHVNPNRTKFIQPIPDGLLTIG